MDDIFLLISNHRTDKTVKLSEKNNPPQSLFGKGTLFPAVRQLQAVRRIRGISAPRRIYLI